MLLLCLLVTAVLLLCRRRPQALLAGAGAIVAALPLSTHRLPPAASGAPPDLRVLVLNTRTTNPFVEEIVDIVERSNASIVVVIEPSGDLARRLRDDAALRSIYPTIRMPSRGEPYQVTLSVWPLAAEGDGWRPFRRGRGVLLDAPCGPVAFVQLHPESPRTRAEWEEGNRAVGEALALARGAFAGFPVIIGADLNSSPAGARSRRVVRSGFDRAKPLTRGAGTYPASLFWPLRVALDDVWASPAWRRTSWETMRIPGSDHLGVCVGLSLDTGPRGSDPSR